jgi:hypothetical protein
MIVPRPLRRNHPRFEGGALAGIATLLLLTATPSLADDGDDAIHGRVELQDAGNFVRGNTLDAQFGGENRNDFLSDIRLTWEPSWNNWSLAVHYVVDTDYGDDIALARDEAGLLPLPPATWFNLTNTFDNSGEFEGSQRIDRLSVAYTTSDFVVRVGRQALTWGSGLVFRPMDLFDPFSPTATDTEYKPGTDMLYTQWLFGDGSDLQFIVVPRPDRLGAQPASDDSSEALHYHGTILGHATTLLLARDHGDWVAGLGVNGALGGATWNVELVPTFLRTGGTRVSSLANISDAVTFLDRNTTVFAEYFHNGFGDNESDLTFATLPPDLVDRLSRGQLFNVRSDYLATGLTMEINPLLNAGPTLIADLDDQSVYALFQATYSLEDNLTLVGGAQAPIGPSGSEFGGLRLAPTGKIFLGSPSQLYLQIRRYF